jgi:hypothetical protein
MLIVSPKNNQCLDHNTLYKIILPTVDRANASGTLFEINFEFQHLIRTEHNIFVA